MLPMPRELPPDGREAAVCCAPILRRAAPAPAALPARGPDCFWLDSWRPEAREACEEDGEERGRKEQGAQAVRSVEERVSSVSVRN